MERPLPEHHELPGELQPMSNQTYRRKDEILGAARRQERCQEIAQEGYPKGTVNGLGVKQLM